MRLSSAERSFIRPNLYLLHRSPGQQSEGLPERALSDAINWSVQTESQSWLCRLLLRALQSGRLCQMKWHVETGTWGSDVY